MAKPVVLVLGASSQMGKAVVRRLGFAGYKVAAVDKCANSVGKIASDNRKVGSQVTAFSADIKTEENAKLLVDRVVEEFGVLNSVVVVPPKNDLRGELINASSMQFDSMMTSMVTTPFRLVKVAVPHLANAENGSVILLSSSAGYAPQLDGGLFAVASTSILSLVKNLAQSAAKHNVRVNGVCTGMIEGDGSGAVWDEPSGETEQQIRQSLQSMIPAGRIGRPSDATGLVEFLLSDRAKYITGENCLVNGGVSFRL